MQQNTPQDYHWDNIIRLFTVMLDKNHVEQLVGKMPELKPLKQLTRAKMPKTQIAKEGVKQIEQMGATDKVLAWSKKYLPEVYHAYQPYQIANIPSEQQVATTPEPFYQQEQETDFAPDYGYQQKQAHEFTPPKTQSTLPLTRKLLTTLRQTQIYISRTEKPWDWPTNGLVISATPQGHGEGEFKAIFQQLLNEQSDNTPTMVDWETVRENLSALQPDNPVSMTISQSLDIPPTPANSPITEQFIILATTYDTEGFKSSNINLAIQRVIQLAHQNKLSHLTIPLPGSGDDQVKPDKAVQLALLALIKAFSSNTASPLREITFVTLSESAIKTASDFFNRRSQSPRNDMAQGEDLLNVATEAYALAETLLLRELAPPLSVGVLGGWGSGKSFIMHLMQERISAIRTQMLTANQAWGDNPQTTSPFVGHVYQIRFDAWTYAKSNLWASLMQTIFFELNRQLSLEKTLAEKLISAEVTTTAEVLRQGGPIWQVLQEVDLASIKHLDDEDLALLQNILKDEATHNMNDLLWATLQTLKEAERAALRDTEKQLAEQKVHLQKAQETLQRQVDKEITAAAEEAAWDPIKTQLKTILGSVYNRFETQIKTANPQTPLDLRDIFRPRFSEIIRLIRQNPFEFGAFILFGSLSIIIPWILSNDLSMLRLPGGVVGLSSIALGISQIVNKWEKIIMESYTLYRKQVDKERERIETERKGRFEKLLANQASALNQNLERATSSETETETEAVETLIEDDNIPAIQLQIEKLEAKATRQRQKVGLTANYISLVDFVNARLDDQLYEQELGLMHQVQRDLSELTEGLLSIEKEMFPRGPARIILYIDDLDRCPPQRVVEVLEATQLLLKTKLFVVVLAIDVRYVMRALEKVYDKILIPDGEPSGLDYIEKIIQLPYRLRPIESKAIPNYLASQITLETSDKENSNQPPPSKEDDTHQTEAKPTNEQHTDSDKPEDDSSISSPEPTIFDEPLAPQIIAFSKGEFDILATIFAQISMSPRAIKRLVNVSKLMKIIWFRRGHIIPETIFQMVIVLLTLSEVHPHLMPGLFDLLRMSAKSLVDDEAIPQTFEYMITNHEPQTPYPQMLTDWQETIKIIDQSNLIPPNLTPAEMGITTLNLVHSFSFVSEPGSRASG